ncbi:hypothetical protein [Pantoea ananatis]|uniref:hypothetical protein n=1 Tax=Pantoea ananas TaxID=553 RepID=UPI003018AED4
MSVFIKFLEYICEVTNKVSFGFFMLVVFIIGLSMESYYYEAKYLMGFSLLFIVKGILEFVCGDKKVSPLLFLLTYAILYSGLFCILIIA